MTDLKKELEVILSEEVKKQIAEDPELANALQDMIAMFHQADHGVKTGQYKTFNDGIEALTGYRPKPVDGPDTDEDDDE